MQELTDDGCDGTDAHSARAVVTEDYLIEVGGEGMPPKASTKDPDDWRGNQEIIQRKLQYSRRQPTPKSLAPVEAKAKKYGWVCMSIAVDSGACDNVIGPKNIPQYEAHIAETADSINGEGFVSASGEEIPNFGQVVLPIVTRERSLKTITFQAAGVAKPLLSAERLNQSGQLVIFDGDQSCIINKQTHEVMALRREEGNFMLDVWIPPASMAEKMGFQRPA